MADKKLLSELTVGDLMDTLSKLPPTTPIVFDEDEQEVRACLPDGSRITVACVL